MTIVNAGDIFETTTTISEGEKNAVITGNWRVFLGGGITYQQAAAGLATKIQAALDPLYRASVVLETVSAARIFPFPAAAELAVVGTPFAGTTWTGKLPDNVAGLISLYGQAAPPRSVGRVYLPFMPATANDTQGRPDATFVAATQTAADTLWKAQLISFTPTVGVLPIIIASDFSAFWDVATRKARKYWGTQRRRLRKYNIRD